MAKIRVGIVGLTPGRGWGANAHVPALRALKGDYEITAVCTTRQESAEAAAKHFGIRHAFADPVALAQHPEVDLVAVTVKVPSHHDPVVAAIEAGKMVYCEWPLGRTTAEAEKLLALAEQRGVRHIVGLQGQTSPINNYVRDLVADGYVGRPLSATVLVAAPNWGATLDGGYQADRTNGANMLTIQGGHALDSISYCIGEFQDVAALVIRQRDQIALAGTGEMIPLTSPDQLVVSAVTEQGVVTAFQIRGGLARGISSLFEIHGDKGDLVVTSPTNFHHDHPGAKLQGAQGKDALADLPVPAKYRLVPDGTPPSSPYNVAQVYAKLAASIRDGTKFSPGFDAAVTRHKLLDRVVKASETGQRQ